MTSSPGSDRPRAGGFTLIELLTVMALIALIGGLGAGAYHVARRNYSFTASAGRIQGILRAARNTALSTGTSAVAVVDPVGRTASAHAFDRVGDWSFDDLEEGGPAFGGSRLSNQGGAVAPGMIGRCLDVSSGGYADCGSDSRFDLRTGIFIEAWVRHGSFPAVKAPLSARRDRKQKGVGRTSDSASAILEKSGSYFLGMTDSGALEGGIGAHRARTGPGVVVPGRWVRVTLRYDGKALELSADGVPREIVRDKKRLRPGSENSLPESAPVSTSSLTISSRGEPFPGEIDEVKLGGSAEPLLYRYSDDEHIIGWKRVIHFDARGHLDAAFHREPVRMVFAELPEPAGGGPRTVVPVDYSVTFEEWLSRWQRATDMRQEVEEAKLEAQLGNARRIVITVDRLGVVK